MATWRIDRASDWGNAKPPCDEAVVVGTQRVARDTDKPVYQVTLNTLEDLVMFIDKYGEIIVSKERIIIYDTYVE